MCAWYNLWCPLHSNCLICTNSKINRDIKLCLLHFDRMSGNGDVRIFLNRRLCTLNENYQTMPINLKGMVIIFIAFRSVKSFSLLLIFLWINMLVCFCFCFCFYFHCFHFFFRFFARLFSHGVQTFLLEHGHIMIQSVYPHGPTGRTCKEPNQQHTSLMY